MSDLDLESDEGENLLYGDGEELLYSSSVRKSSVTSFRKDGSSHEIHDNYKHTDDDDDHDHDHDSVNLEQKKPSYGRNRNGRNDSRPVRNSAASSTATSFATSSIPMVPQIPSAAGPGRRFGGAYRTARPRHYEMSRRDRLTVYFGILFVLGGVALLGWGIMIQRPTLIIAPSPVPPTPFGNMRTFYPTPDLNAVPPIVNTPAPIILVNSQLSRIAIELEEAFSNTDFTQGGPPITSLDFQDITSAQYQALEWMSIQDRYYLPIGSGGINIAKRWLIVVLYYQFGGENWKNSPTWLTNTDICLWEGIVCEDVLSNGEMEIVEIDLSTKGLKGEIPKEITYFVHLRTFNIRKNSIFGNIPIQIGRLTNLTHLEIQLNENIVGTIPTEIGLLSNLKEIHMNNCTLSGVIPTEIGFISSLEVLNLNTNTIRGFIPTQLGFLLNMKILQLGDNGFFGKIPAELGNLNNLEQLELWSNDLSGNIPETLSQLSNLSEYVYIHVNSDPFPLLTLYIKVIYPNYLPIFIKHGQITYSLITIILLVFYQYFWVIYL